MERQFSINWPAIVEEAKQRRKEQRLTQAQLALLAKVSVPTVSRFENDEKDLQLSTVMRILAILGLQDSRYLNFPEKTVYHDSIRKKIVFSGKDRQGTVQCEIAEETLSDYFSGHGKDLLKIFQKNRGRITQEARRKYLKENLEAERKVSLSNKDFE